MHCPDAVDGHFQDIMNRVQEVLGKKIKPMEVTTLKLNNPHTTQRRSMIPNILPGKCIVIPLEKVYAEFKVPNDTDAKFYIFEQMYFDRPVKCFKNKQSARKYEKGNESIFTYEDVYKLHEDNRVPKH